MNPTTTSKDLGFVKAIYEGTTPPNNTMMVWADTSAMPEDVVVHKYFNHILEQWIPLGTGSGSVTLNSNVKLGRVIFVSKEGNDTTGEIGNLAKTFLTIPAALAQAATLFPIATNRVTIILYPGLYSEAITIGNDFVDIYSFDAKSVLYSEKAFNTVDYENRKRNVVIQGNITWNSRFNFIAGVDMKNVSMQLFTNQNSLRCIKNSIIDSIQSMDITGSSTQNNIIMFDCLVNSMFNCKSDMLFIGVEATNCVINQAFDSGSVPASYPTNVRVQDSVFDNTVFAGNSFSFNNVGFRVKDSLFSDCIFKGDSISILDTSKIVDCKFGNNAIKNSIASKIILSDFGQNCLRDFLDTTMYKLTTVNSVGLGGSLDYLSGNLDDVTCDYVDGFASGRFFYGKMRHMFIRTTNVANPALRIKRPALAIPANIEFSTIMHCIAAGNTVVGDDMYMSYCKLNKANQNVNVFGSAPAAFNIISGDLCSYTSNPVCTPPSAFTLVSSVPGSGNITFTFNATLPTARAGTQLQITHPNSTVEIQMVEVGNSGGSPTITFGVTVTPQLTGTYTFRIRTVCAIDGNSNPTSVSSWSNQQIYNSVVARPTAWRGIEPSCVLAYSVYVFQELDTQDENMFYQITRDFDDGATSFVCSLTFPGYPGYGPITVVFQPGSLISDPLFIANVLLSGLTPVISVLPNSYTGTRVPRQTGMVHIATLEEYYIDDSTATGNTAPNTIGDPNYIADYEDEAECPPDEIITVPDFLTCDVFLNVGKRIVLYKDGQTYLLATRFAAGASDYTDIAIIGNKLYAAGFSHDVDVWNINTNSLSFDQVVPNALHGNCSSMGSLGNALIYNENGTNDVYSLDVTSWVNTLTTYGEKGFALQGDIMAQNNGGYLVATVFKATSSLQSWIVPSGAITVDMPITNAAGGGALTNMYGIFQKSSLLHLLGSNGRIYTFDFNTGQATQVDDISAQFSGSWNGAAQRPTCGTILPIPS